MRAVEINAMVKALNNATEIGDKHADELVTLRESSNERPLTGAEQRRLKEIREANGNVQARQAEIDRLNANANFIEYHFSLVNGRIVSRKRAPEEMVKAIKQAAKR